MRTKGNRIVQTLGRQVWLDRPSYRLEHVLTLVFASCGRYRDRVSNALHGTWLGHPLHPALTAVPTGAIGTAVALDAVSLLPGDKAALREASRLALGLGIAGSVGAACTGVTDWQHTHEHSRRIGLIHGALNVAATGLYVASWWDRGRGRHLRGIAATALGYGISLASGYLGGALVFGAGIGVDRSGARLKSDAWTPALPLAALDGRPQRVDLAGVGVVVYRNGGQVFAVGEHCPHLGAPMSDGWIDRGRIVCPWHGSYFECYTGDVVRGPATAALPRYPTRVRAGIVEVRGTVTAADGGAR
ncbi:Rieske 2Fe-2S domain-containing protein [Mycobacterium sp. Marseille-P9652]|uniref:Rieske 2Fe-2S domain-containing protein n=1 Tax=Mycobacterium sp. Marseille-P9652 TaxID=2654950 RepID=UPI001E587F88|nr:Rieske 2Fe-2S domain-containing protein [Mycobacterium sp. Marseille-P9652]